MNSDPIYIACATDEAYVPVCGIMLTSLFMNNPHNSLHVYILSNSLSDVSRKKLSQLAEQFHQKIEILFPDPQKFTNCPVRPGDHISTAAYYRLNLPNLIPDAVNRIIYLDCDMLVVDDLRGLWNVDIEQYALAICHDEDYVSNEKYQRLQISEENPYFNSGVLLFNLKYWRKNNTEKACFDCIRHNADILRWHDQDTLNIVLCGHVSYLPLKYNLQTGFLYKRYMFEQYPADFRQKVWDAIASPVVIHFSGSSKPWHSRVSSHPFSNYFWKYQKMSLWNDFSAPPPSLCFLWKRFYAHLLYGLGLVKQPETYIITKQAPL